MFPAEGVSKAKIASSCIKIVIAGLTLNIIASLATLLKNVYLRVQKLYRKFKLNQIHDFETVVDGALQNTKNEIISNEI